jgi:hypothetical protein
MFSPKWFHKMLDAHNAELKSSHREKLAKSSNPLNLGKARWEEEEKYQMAPWDGKLSRGKELRRLGEENGQRQRWIRARGGNRRRPREGGGAPGKIEGGVNEGTDRVSLTPTLFDPGQNR